MADTASVNTVKVRDVKQLLVSDVYLERLLTARVPAVETVLGALVWLGFLIGFVREIGAALWMLSALVGLPLALRLAERPTSGPSAASISWLRVLAVPVATLSSLSLLTSGPFAFLLSLPWFVLTSLVAVAGLFRFLSRPSLADPMVAMDAGLVMVGMIGASFTLDRLGTALISNVGLQATAFAVPFAVAECARRRKDRWWIPQLLTLSVPVGALALVLGGTPRFVGYGLIGLACAWVAVLLIRVGAEQSVGAQVGLLFGGVALGLGAGVLVAAQAFTFLDLDGEAIDLMRRFDGPLIGLGFVVPALLGLNLLPTESGTGQRRTFFHLGPPTREQISRLAADLPPQVSKADLNPLADNAPAGYRLRRVSRPVPGFGNSRQAIWNWAGHEAAGISLAPEVPPILMGQDLVFVIPFGPFTITATGRVVALISDEDHFGFVYSTLDHHPFIGTEAIMLDRSSGRSTLTISTVWRPNCLAARLAGPIGNIFIGRIVGGYLDGIAEAENASIGARMMDVISNVDDAPYSMSHNAIRGDSTLSQLLGGKVHAGATQPLSDFEALFAPAAEPDHSDVLDKPTENESS